MLSDADVPREENNSPCDSGANLPHTHQHTDLSPMANTFSKDERLKKGDFRGTRWNKRAETPHFLLLVHRNEQGEKKLGITIRKKTGGAVVRNRMRRLVKEFYRLNKDLFPDRHNNLLKIKQVPERLTWTETDKELHELLQVKTL
jgi:ribonuclease P protein component